MPWSMSAINGEPFLFAIALSTSVIPRPYTVPAIEHLMNSMELQVNVPVLSVRIVST
uniref:Haloacid dehalogenase-like hydrolase family protein n=1 Tax=Arundo donax TaxID=35708 RepID=A0A0A9HED5_ARUDO